MIVDGGSEDGGEDGHEERDEGENGGDEIEGAGVVEWLESLVSNQISTTHRLL